MRALIILCTVAAVLPLATRQPFYQTNPSHAIRQILNGNGEWTVRRIANPTRSVHPAEECYRAAGWRIRPLPMRLDEGRRWGCFAAARQAEQLEVCQTFIDSRGRSWSDAGSWWWAALLRRTEGPWTVIVSASPIRHPH